MSEYQDSEIEGFLTDLDCNLEKSDCSLNISSDSDGSKAGKTEKMRGKTEKSTVESLKLQLFEANLKVDLLKSRAEGKNSLNRLEK